MISAQQALERLHKGNLRFVNEQPTQGSLTTGAHRLALKDQQTPFAVILGCSDSRVPLEIIFDQGLGELFVIRVAGNIVASSQIGSVEFAVESFGTPLVVVLGHSHCGAIQATLAAMAAPLEMKANHLDAIVGRIRPGIASIAQAGLDDEETLKQAVRANIAASVEQLQQGSQFLAQKASEGSLIIIGAEYCLASGKVEFFESQR